MATKKRAKPSRKARPFPLAERINRGRIELEAMALIDTGAKTVGVMTVRKLLGAMKRRGDYNETLQEILVKQKQEVAAMAARYANDVGKARNVETDTTLSMALASFAGVLGITQFKCGACDMITGVKLDEQGHRLCSNCGAAVEEQKAPDDRMSGVRGITTDYLPASVGFEATAAVKVAAAVKVLRDLEWSGVRGLANDDPCCPVCRAYAGSPGHSREEHDSTCALNAVLKAYPTTDDVPPLVEAKPVEVDKGFPF